MNVGRYLRGEDRHVGTSRITNKAAPTQDCCGGCTLAGPGRGDCEHYVGLPGVSIPNQHDGDDDTVDAYGKPNGWCWSCWKSKQLADAAAQIALAQREKSDCLKATARMETERNELREQIAKLEADALKPMSDEEIMILWMGHLAKGSGLIENAEIVAFARRLGVPKP